MKKIIALLLCFLLIFTSLGINVFGFSATTGNVALNKPTKYSSAYNNFHETQGAHNAVDGNLNTEFASSLDATGSWFIVDLEKSYRLSKIRLAGRWRMEEPEGLKNFEVQLSNDESFKEYEVVHRQGQDSIGFQKWLEITISSQQEYRYVRYIGTVACVRTVSELEVYDSNLTFDSPLKSYNDKTYAKALKLLEYLNVLGIQDFNESRPVTRGEIISQLIKLAGYDKELSFNKEQVFVDVDSDHPYFSDINTAYQFGWLSMPDDGRFGPNEYVTKTAFLKLLLYSIGYGEFIETRGGWPFGVDIIARELKLMSGVDVKEDRVLLQSEMMVMMYNALCAPYFRIEGATDDYIAYAESDCSILEYKHNIVEVSGIITANQYTDFDGTDGVSDGQIELKSIIYDDPTGDAALYLGYDTECLVDIETDTVIVAAKSERNNEECFKGYDITSTQGDFNKRRINYWNENSDKNSIYMDSGFVVIHTGIVYDGYTFDSFKKDNVYITALDNDDNGGIDVLFVYEYDSFVVKSAFYDGNKGAICGENGKTYTFEDIDETMMKILIEGGSTDTVDALEPGDVISISQHPGGKSTVIQVSLTKSFSGKVDLVSMSDDMSIKVNSVNYKINSGYLLAKAEQSEYASEIKAGKSYNFKTNIYGEIVSVEKNNGEDTEYMFVIKAASGEGLDANVKFKVYRTNGKIEILTAAPKMTLDRTRYTVEQLDEKLRNKPDFIPQDVAIITVNNGLVTEIDTVHIDFSKGETKENSLDKTVFADGLLWNWYHNAVYFDTGYVIAARHGNNSPVFGIPFSTENGIEKVASNEEKLFNVYVSPAQIVNGVNEEVTGITAAYDVDPLTKHSDIYLKKLDVSDAGNPALREGESFVLVSDVYKELDTEEDTIMLMVKGYSHKGEFVHPIEDETLANITDGDKIKPGDIIRCRLNDVTNKIANFEFLFRPDVDMEKFDREGEGLWFVDGIPTSFRGNSRANFCVLLGVKDGYFSVADVLPLADGSNKDEVFNRTDSYELSKFKYYSYSEKRDKVEVQNSSFLTSMLYESNPNARFIVLTGRNATNDFVVGYYNDN